MSDLAHSLLDVRGLSKHFGGIYALNDTTMAIRQGEVHALIGPNGAGKTTLIHVLSGALAADGGAVTFAGHDLLGHSMHRRVTLGLARSYQITNIFSRLTVLDNLTMAVQSRTRDWGTSFSFWKPFSLEAGIIEEARQLLADVSLGGLEGRIAGQLSHGEQRCLEVALALATKPSLLLLDEPSLGLAPLLVRSIFETVRAINKRGVTVLLVEQNARAALKLASRGYVLEVGKVVMEDKAQSLLNNASVREAYLGG